MPTVIFPFADYWWFYLAFTAFVLMLLVIDLGVFHRHARAVSIRESAGWSVVWVSLALLFNAGLYAYVHHKFSSDAAMAAATGMTPDTAASRVALEFLTGFIIEKSLAVDNIFVFVVVFSFFAVPSIYQHRVLFFGIMGALVFRGIFIALGAALLKFHWVMMLVGVFLIFTGIKMIFSQDEDPNPADNPIIKWVQRVLPVTPEIHGQSFFKRIDGRIYATPLLLGLIFIEVSDIVFAIDSVPAIFGITREPLIVYTSNIFAILGLRSLYFLLAGVVDKFHYLKYAIALILVFVGSKMTWISKVIGEELSMGWSLSIIGGFLAGGIVASLLATARQPNE
ncbi:MAG: TerC family protein [Deltaproteobacteria bacterium]|nr:TerC family protein [Deltaproteobacteria bacterium]